MTHDEGPGFPGPRVLLARRVWRIGVETLWREGDRFFVRLDNRTYHSEHEIGVEAARQRHAVMTAGRRSTGSSSADAPDAPI